MLGLPKPSLGQMATSPGDSEYPELWNGLIMACDAGINDNANRWTDWSGKGNHWATLNNTSFKQDELRGLRTTGGNSGAKTGIVNIDKRELTVVIDFKSYEASSIKYPILEASSQYNGSGNSNSFIVYLGSTDKLEWARCNNSTSALNVRDSALHNRRIRSLVGISFSANTNSDPYDALCYLNGLLIPSYIVGANDDQNYSTFGAYNWFLSQRNLTDTGYSVNAIYYKLFAWNRVLTPQEHQILALGGSPLVKRRRLWMFARGAASLTDVTATRQVISSVQAAVIASRQVQAMALAGVTGQRQAVASVMASAQGNRQVVAAVRGPVQGARSVVANTLSSVTGVRQIQTTVCLDLSATRQLISTICTGVSATRSLIVPVRARVIATRIIVAQVESQKIVRVGAELTLQLSTCDFTRNATRETLGMYLPVTDLTFDLDMKTFTTEPYLTFTLAKDGDVPDFTGKTIIIAGTIGGVQQFKKNAEIVDANAGTVRIRLDEKEISTAGRLRMMAFLKDADGRIEPFPSTGYCEEIVEESIVKP